MPHWSKHTALEVASAVWKSAYEVATAKCQQRAGDVPAATKLLEAVMDVSKMSRSILAPAVRTCLQKLWCCGGASAAGCEC